jgi:hypothetical protein
MNLKTAIQVKHLKRCFGTNEVIKRLVVSFLIAGISLIIISVVCITLFHKINHMEVE